MRKRRRSVLAVCISLLINFFALWCIGEMAARMIAAAVPEVIELDLVSTVDSPVSTMDEPVWNSSVPSGSAYPSSQSAIPASRMQRGSFAGAAPAMPQSAGGEMEGVADSYGSGEATGDITNSGGNVSGGGGASGGGEAGGSQGTGTVAAGPISRPQILYQTKPHYPEKAKMRGIEGTVRVRVLVDEAGQPANVSVAESSGSHLLDKAAMEAVQQWTFVPARQASGRAIRCYTSFNVVFDITNA